MRIVLAFLLLSGCTPYEQRVQNACTRLGMGPDSPHYPQCVQQMIDADTASRAMWLGVARTGAATVQNSQPVYVPPTTLNCTTYRQGVYTQTRCF